MTSIEYGAFYGCSSLTSVTSLIEEPFAIGDIFEGCDNITLYVPAGTKSKYEATDGWKNFTNIVEVDLNSIIDFADATVKAICVKHWDTNGDGMLSYDEAAAVTDIGSVFSSNKEITSFDELQYFTGLKSIGNSAFYGCKGITSITIPDSVTSIGESAFAGCRSLTSVTIGNSVVSIGWFAFDGCSGLASIIIPNSVTTIEGYAFRGCSSLTSITIGSSVTSIGGYAFRGCSSLTSITIGSSVTSIGNIVFEDCSNLTFIRVDEGNPVFDSRENCNAIVMTENNELIVGCKNTIIPNSVTSIGESAFESCSSLTSIEIPNSVTSIGVSAFRECIGLTSITIPNSITTIGKHAFFDCSNLTDVSLSEGLISIGEEAFHTCAISTISLPQSLIRIGEQAFQGCRQLTSITLPKNVAYLGNADYIDSYGEMQEEDDLYGDVFNGCDLLADVKVDEQNQAYASVEGLLMTKDMKTLLYIPGAKTEVVVPEGTETIHSDALSSDNLTTITLPKSLKNIEDYALTTEKSILTSIISKNENPTPISNSAFYYITYDNATLYVPIGTKSKYEATDGWKNFKNIVEMDLLPVDNGQTIDFGTDIDENTNLNGNIMDNVFVNVNNGDGSYDPSEGCIIVSKPTDDSAIDGKEIFGEDFKDNYTGIVFKLAPGEGTIKVEAQTTGNMVLKVKIGDGMPITMELEGKLKVSFPYNVSEDTYVYIYGGLNTSNNAKGMRRVEPADGTLKIYGIEVDSKANDIESLEVSQDDIATIYNLNGHRINSLQRGVNIIRMNDGTVRKVVVK